MLWDWVELLGWNRIFSSSTLPSIQISKEQVLVTCEDMAVVVCQEDTCPILLPNPRHCLPMTGLLSILKYVGGS